MKKNLRFLSLAVLLLTATGLTAQSIDALIREAEVSRILKTLSSDAMEGRRTFTPGIEKAADFIAGEFGRIGLEPLKAGGGYRQRFSMTQSNVRGGTATIGGKPLELSSIICQTDKPELSLTPSSGFEVIRMRSGDNAMAVMRTLRGKSGNLLILLDSSHQPLFARLKANNSPRMPGSPTIVYALTPEVDATDYRFQLTLDLQEKQLSNVVGKITGKSRKEEYVVFSAHYDHLGYGRPDAKGDSLYNGANDDASGTTAVVLLAEYFAKQNEKPERTLLFVAFTAEEVGGFGSQYFSRQLSPEKVMAMFNIEMIGTDSKWGTNSAYITGYERSSMGTILEKNLQGSQFRFYPDPYPQQNLFYRSDNATLARLGVPAHTISTSKMDIEPHYHKPSDEFETLDMRNMTEIIKAIAISSRSIVAGADTPSRVDTSQLQ